MINLIIFFLAFYFLIISVIGYGFFFQRAIYGEIKNLDHKKMIYTGFYGLFCLTLISLFSSFFYQHNFTHNLLLHLCGLIFFFLIKFDNKKKYLKSIFIISIFTISAILISKTHDDFSYYHLPFTKYLTEHKIIFGMGNLLHGYKLLSSLFYLNSTFYLPYIEYYAFHFSSFYFLIFFNYFLYREISLKKNNDVTKYLYLFALLFFNLSFNRIAEYGTDKAGQLLIVLLLIKILKLTCFEKNKNNLNEILFITPLAIFCVTLKTYFISYILIIFTIFFIRKKIKNIFKKIFFSKAFLIAIVTLFIYLSHHFISTGCIISPISLTCFGNNLSWAYSEKHYEKLSRWLEQWSKAGAGPNFRVENADIYIQNFNWLPRWFEFYFMDKVKDQLLILLVIFLVSFTILKKIKIDKKILTIRKDLLFFYLIIILIFLIWFSKHPQLRYGGYSITFLLLSIPAAIFFEKFQTKNNFKKKFRLLILLVIIIFNLKNFNRINNELHRADFYKFSNFPFFAILEKPYSYEVTSSGLTIYKTKGHCWNVPSPCVQSLDKFRLKTVKKNGYYFINSNK